MAKIPELLSKFFICSTLFSACGFAQANLTQILDTVYNADKSRFNGTLIISWQGFTSSAGSTIGPNSTSTQILNGVLSVFLVPSTTASAGACYVANYNSSDGTITWTETWQVPPSSTPLTLNQVRQPGACDPGGSGGGGGGGGSVSIADVVGLSADLSGINGSLTTLTTTVNGVTSTVATLSTQVANLTSLVNNLNSGSNVAFTDGERPSGTINSINTVFTLASAPSPAASLSLYRNGLALTNGPDYTLAGAAITFASGAVPQSGDILEAYYRIAGTGQMAHFSDDEIPTGMINGANLTFTLAGLPNPALSLRLYRNGVLLEQNVDYTLTGAVITLASTETPQTGDSLRAYYRF